MLPNKFIVSKKPKEYLKQGLSHCGVGTLLLEVICMWKLGVVE